MRTALPRFVHSLITGAREYALYGPALELIAAQGTAIGATLAALTPVAGDTLSVRNTGGAAAAKILQAWADVQVAGTGRLRSPKFHDNVQGIRFATKIGDLRPVFPWGLGQAVYPNDVIVVELAGSAVAGDVETIMQLIH